MSSRPSSPAAGPTNASQTWEARLRRGQLPLLSRAMETIPLGTAYAVWNGIGAVGTVLVGAFAFGEKLRPAMLALLGLVVAMIVGLKVIA
ncbi:DMT family transporter [Micropruina sonneratiae]|uniref:DMT family transporter n=1 Tax=Micropruina sonneratiae TaxID=2986940 RepID=UPI002227E8CB|nr:SMR family transporter [Micropruina sp. KQZ13P-5]MCW3159285.1 SMR family transporter [Micropruina sp. KQZ13P-5]